MSTEPQPGTDAAPGDDKRDAGTDATRDPHAAAWRRAQAVSGLCLAVFVGVHLVNLPLAAFPGAYDAYQRVLRVVYQSPFFEIPFVFLPLAVHLTAGVRAILRSKSRAPARTWPARLHRWSAWYLLAMVVGHIIATRGPSLVLGVYPESLGLAFSLQWIPLWFWPYYALLGLSGVAHLGYGVPRALSVVRRHADRSASSRPLAIALGVAGVAVLVGLLGIGGLLYEIGDPFAHAYADIYRDFDDSPFVPDIRDPRPSGDEADPR